VLISQNQYLGNQICRYKIKRIVNPWLIDAECNSASAALNICGTNPEQQGGKTQDIILFNPIRRLETVLFAIPDYPDDTYRTISLINFFLNLMNFRRV